MKTETYTFTAPSAWACYLINGDEDSISDEDKAAADAFVRWVALDDTIACVSCEDAGFIWHHDAHQFLPLGADCQTYTFLIHKE